MIRYDYISHILAITKTFLAGDMRQLAIILIFHASYILFSSGPPRLGIRYLICRPCCHHTYGSPLDLVLSGWTALVPIESSVPDSSGEESLPLPFFEMRSGFTV